MPEAAEAQLKIANIHYQQMEKADRDYTHAKRAEDEYRKMILTYPDSKIVPEAKRKLLEVQEVLAEREFGIGRFYYLRESYPASIARLSSLLEKYPLYSRADEAAWLLGQNYEGQMARIRNSPTCDAKGFPRGCVSEAAKAKYAEEFTKDAAKAYDKILTRYPLMDRAEDAKRRLAALHQAIPRPTKAAVAQNKAEIESRGESSMMQRMTGLIKKGPDVAKATQVGDPNLVEPEPIAATSVVRQETIGAMGMADKTAIGAEIVKPDQPGLAPSADANSTIQTPLGVTIKEPTPAPAATNDPNELKPTASADSNELTPNAGDQNLPPPTQVNEIPQGASSSKDSAKSNNESTPASDEDISSSKKQKKKGLKKVIPF
jgi:outer membrane protein assembly factor BamD